MVLDDVIQLVAGDIKVKMVDVHGAFIGSKLMPYHEGYDLNFLADFGRCSVEELWGDYDRDDTYHEIERVYITVTITV